MKSKTQNNNIKQKDIDNKFKSLKDILKEKILYDYYCNKHNMNYFKYCSICKKDICVQCEKDLHKGHQFINYENIMPDLNEINIMREILKEYEKNYHLFINIINNCKKEFEIMLNEYKIRMNSMIDFIFNFNNEKINFNSIYKYRNIFSILLNSDSDKNKRNSKIIELMEKMWKNKDKDKENIKNEYKWILNNNKFKELLSSLNNDIFSHKIKKIVEVINIKERNSICNANEKNGIIIKKISGKIHNRVNYINNEITPCFNAQIKNNSSSDKNNNTSASSIGNNKLKKISVENDNNHIFSKNSEVINFEYTFNKDYKSNHSKSTSNINYNNKKMNKFNLCIYEKKKIRQKSTDYVKNVKNLKLSINNNNNNNKIKMNEDTLQNSINDTKIYLFKKRQRRNKKFLSKNMISNKTQNIINKTFLYNYKGFDIYDRDSGPELLNNTSSTIQGVKYVSHSLRNNSMDYATNKNPSFNPYTGGAGRNYISTTYSMDNISNSNNNTFTVDKNNTCNILNNYRNFNKNSSLCRLSRNDFKMNNYLNNTSIRFYKPHKNNSVENINYNSKHMVNNSFVNNINSSINKNDKKMHLVYIDKKKDNSIYVNKKFITLDMSKSLSSIDSITSSIISSNSTNRNKNVNTNNIFLNQINNNTTVNSNKKIMYKNKTYHINKSKGNRLFIGLELGNTECKIGLLKQNSNFESSFNQSEYYSIPTIITFISNNANNNPKNVFGIKIGEEAKKFELINPSQTIFNIVKLFGKNTNEIIGRKDLWPFNIYNDSQTNKPIIKIKYNTGKDDKKSKYVFYNFEEILTIYLKKVFEMFFSKIKLSLDNKENYNANTDKIEDISIDITIGVPNYFNYLQRKIIQKIFNTNIFPKKEVDKYNSFKNKRNIFGKYNIQLNRIKVENVSNLASFYSISKFINMNSAQKIYKNNLFLHMEGGSVNISIINFSINNNNYFIEVKAISGAEFGDEDFLDNFIYDCLSDFKEKIRNNCLNSPLALAKLRKSLNITKKCFDKGEIMRTEVNIDKLFRNLDLKMTVNQMSYQKSCMGLFRKIIYLIKETIINSKIDIKDINDIILIGNMTQNTKLKKMISEIFKDNNKDIYNKLINESNKYNNDIDNSIIKGSIIQSFNSNMVIPKYKLINICQSSFGVENANGFMDIVIEKGSIIPIKFNKYIRIRKLRGNNMVNINIYEGENKCVRNNKLIASNSIDISNYKQERKDEKSIEILFQFYIDSNYNLNVFILDKISFRRQFECLMNINNE